MRGVAVVPSKWHASVSASHAELSVRTVVDKLDKLSNVVQHVGQNPFENVAQKIVFFKIENFDFNWGKNSFKIISNFVSKPTNKQTS